MRVIIFTGSDFSVLTQALLQAESQGLLEAKVVKSEAEPELQGLGIDSIIDELPAVELRSELAPQRLHANKAEWRRAMKRGQ